MKFILRLSGMKVGTVLLVHYIVYPKLTITKP